MAQASTSSPPPTQASTPAPPATPVAELSPYDPEVYARTEEILTRHAQVGSAVGTAAGAAIPVYRARTQLRMGGRGGGPNIFVQLLGKAFIWGGAGYFVGGGVGAFGTGQYAMLKVVKAEKLKLDQAAAAGQVPP